MRNPLELQKMILILIIFLPVPQVLPNPQHQYHQDVQDPQNLQDSRGLMDRQDLENLQHLQYHQDVQDPQNLQDRIGLMDRQDLEQNLQHLQYQCPGGNCNPQLGDLMIGRAAQLSATSTCGWDRPEQYCIIGYLEEENKCFVCDSHLPYDRYSNQNSHRIENVITAFDPERKKKWWQSENGVHHVSIRLDLETVFQLSHLVLTFKSFRPVAMLVERSKDFGRTWKVFRYFANDCLLHFPSVSTGPARSVDDIICDSRYSSSEPSTDGEVVLKALDPVFEIQNPYSPNIQNLITLTNIRVNFTRLFTLGDTLLRRRRRDPQNKYYYALYNMVVQGSCFCNGHATHCMPLEGRHTHNGMVHGHCVCQHNTAGENCEWCQDFHHDSPWRPGNGNVTDVCRRCHCHGHSNSCHFDDARFASTGGISGGVCDDCQHERAGPQCERCLPFYYQDPQKDKDDPHSCISCDCAADGSAGEGVCDAITGQCVCKENVEGRRCDRCKPGFFNLRHDDPAGCQACRCHPLGSVGSCDQLRGSCECDSLAVGELCDRCVMGFWGLGTSQFRCSSCDCNVGGAFSNMCSPDDGQCNCLPNMIGRRCSDPAPGYFLPSVDCFLYEAEHAAPLAAPLIVESTDAPTNAPKPLSAQLNPPCEEYFRSQGFDFQFSNGRVVLTRRTRRNLLTRGLPRSRRQSNSIPLDPGHALQIVPRQRTPDKPVTWTGLGLVRVLDGAGLGFTVDNLPSSMDYQLVIRYEPETPSDWLAAISIIMMSPGDGVCSREPSESETLVLPGNSRTNLLESKVCLNAGGRYFVSVILRKRDPGSYGSYILIDWIGLIPTVESVQDFCSQTDLDSFSQFHCVGLAAELEICKNIIKSLSAQIHRGAVLCRCNPTGSVGPSCSEVGGVCECRPNVIGSCCDTCAPLTFGFGPDGCKPCTCDPQGSVTSLCDEVSGQCSCRAKVTGQHCNRCQQGLWGFPLCQPCDCNGLSEECNAETGECQNCRENAAGPHCNRCVDGYFGDPVSGSFCQLCLCPDVPSSGRFFATSCQHDPQSLHVVCECRNGHTGTRCDRCIPGFYGDLMLPDSGCEPCPCNNNIDVDDIDACDHLTGECLRCLGNTAGAQCQHCKPGFYGKALMQDCKECFCDRRGTVVTQCPVGSPCFCDTETGQCPCRTGVTGVICDTCGDGFWNLDGLSGCQPCQCDPLNSASNICDKVTGQCLCRPEFGGRQCDECAENHFGNLDLQCVSCDCNLEGTRRPSCDIETGECLCRVGVTGIFCDECALGFSSAFPSCEPCHPCTSLWTDSVTDVQRASQRMRSFIPGHSDDLQPKERRQRQRMLQVHSLMDGLTIFTSMSPKNLEKVEKFCLKIGRLRDVVNPNLILINPSPLLDTDINYIQWEFEKLLKNLKKKIIQDPDQEKDVKALQDEVQKLHKNFLFNDKKVKHAAKSLELSVETRLEAENKLSTCKNQVSLEKIKNLSVVQLNQKVCGHPALDDCSGCGGALCFQTGGQRKCAGPNCDGALPISETASETARRTKNQLVSLPYALEKDRNKILEAKQSAQETKRQAKESQNQIQERLKTFEKEKNRSRELIQRARDFLRDYSVPPEDIEKMARAVLRIGLPRSPAHIQSIIAEIHHLLSSSSLLPTDLGNLRNTKVVEALLMKARELKEKTRDVDVMDKKIYIYDAERAQDKANDDLDTVSQVRDMLRQRNQEITDKLMNIEMALMACHPENLKKEIEALKKKNNDNREMARDAQLTPVAALNATDMDLGVVMKAFELLKQKNSTRVHQGQTGERVRNITEEAEKMKRQVENKLAEIQGLDRKIQELIRRKNEKVTEVSELLKTAESLRGQISKRAEEYASCTA